MTYINRNGRQNHRRFTLNVYLSPKEQDDDKSKRETKSRSYLDPFKILELGIRWLLKLVEIGARVFFDKVFVPRLERLREMYERWRNK